MEVDSPAGLEAELWESAGPSSLGPQGPGCSLPPQALGGVAVSVSVHTPPPSLCVSLTRTPVPVPRTQDITRLSSSSHVLNLLASARILVSRLGNPQVLEIRV